MAQNWGTVLTILLIFRVYGSSAQKASNLGKPWNIPASQWWDGEDGPWSTFRVGVGNDSTQQIRVLPGSGQSSTWAVLPEGCDSTYTAVSQCEQARGGLYRRNETRTWKEYGQYDLSTYLEKRVGMDGKGLYGYDTMTLGWPGDGAPVLNNQSIAGIISPNFTVGVLGLSARPVNFTSYNNPVPSLLQNLRNAINPIPSLTWSYTAGNFNYEPKGFGSLVLGGHDTSQFTHNELTFPFGKDLSLDLQVVIQRTSTSGSNGTVVLTNNPTVAYISTLVSDMWLPGTVVDRMMTEFNMSHDVAHDYYYIEKAAHERNLKVVNDGPLVSYLQLRVGPTTTSDSVDISFEYPWLVKQIPSQYEMDHPGAVRIPIKRATSENQYILGRAFLTAAYLTVDYDRGSFKLYQANNQSWAMTSNTIEAILPPGISNSTSQKEEDTLGGGAIAGIAVASSIITLAGAALVWFWWRRKQRTAKGKKLEDDETQIDVQDTQTYELTGDHKRYEMQVGGGQKHEVEGDMIPKVELSSCKEQEKPAEFANTQAAIYELPATERKAKEMEGEGHMKKVG